MRCFLVGFLAMSPLLSSGAQAQNTEGPFLIQNGQTRSVLVAPANPSPPVQMAIDEFQYHLQRAGGVKLRVVDENQATALPSDIIRVIIGSDVLAKQMGIDVATLPLDTYRIKSSANSLLFVGRDSNVTSGDAFVGNWNAATMWAVDHYLDTQLGVRWLWPGDVGTYVPRHTSIPLPQIDYTGRPPLETRLLVTRFHERSLNNSPLILSDDEFKQVSGEAYTWLRRFQMGNRTTKKFGHAFTTWWGKYGATHPEYFAVPPAGSNKKQPWPSAKGVKLNVGSEAVDEAIIAEWKAAGSPDNWNVSPNDGVGFDTSAASRAMDDPPNQDPQKIWGTAEANLTARYVKFWNRLIVKMRRTNPNVTLSSYAYSSYRNPPINGLKLESGIILQSVPSYWAEDEWLKWQQAGASLLLRPNWWHTGGPAPVMPLHREGNFFKFALDHNMAGFNYDTLHGFWATRGPQYYITARLSVHPGMSVDDVLNEYYSAFGKAAPDIKEYLAYWEEFTEKAAYSIAAGGEVAQPKLGLYVKILKENKLSTHPLSGSWTIIPHLYTDDALNRGYAILNRAAQTASDDDEYVKQRIQFLRSGLDHLKLTRDVLRLGYVKKRTSAQEAEYKQMARQLQQRRHTWTLQHVIWGEIENVYEARRGFAPTMPGLKREEKEELRGM
jgi:hypothetical protein